MKAIDFKERNVIFAEDQKEYFPLPAHAQGNGIVTFCMEVDDEEIKLIQANKSVSITVLTFGRPVQPMKIGTVMPELPISYEAPFKVNAESWNEKSEATVKFDLMPLQIQGLKKNKVLWVTVATFGTPLQPISMTLN